MQEPIIGFELAKLAKEKGFDLSQIDFYMGGGLLCTNLDYGSWIASHDRMDVYQAPTQSLLQKWLREKHNIHIQILPYNHKYLISILKYGQNGSNPNFDNEFDTYEEALETGLFKALKLI